MINKRLLLLALLLPMATAHAEQKTWLENSKQWVQQLWQNDAKLWLERINSAVYSNNYKGVIVFAQGANMSSLAVDHQMQNGVETLRLRTLSGAPKELLKKGGQIHTNTLNRQSQYSSGVAAEQTGFSQFANAADNKWYKVGLGEKGRVAGRTTQIINISAEDQLRYSYRLWLDEQTGLPLRVVTLDENKNIVEQVVFTQIQITPAAKQVKMTSAKTKKPLDSPYKVIKGFELVGKEIIGASTHYLYSDGLSSFSLYVEPSRALEKSQMKKDTVNGLIIGNGTMRYVVIGKVPVTTLERVLLATQTK